LGFGRELGLLDESQAERLARLIHRVERLPSLKGISLDDLWCALYRDKKFRAGNIRMVLLPRLGETLLLAGIDPIRLKRFLGKFLSGGGQLFCGTAAGR